MTFNINQLNLSQSEVKKPKYNGYYLMDNPSDVYLSSATYFITEVAEKSMHVFLHELNAENVQNCKRILSQIGGYCEYFQAQYAFEIVNQMQENFLKVNADEFDRSQIPVLKQELMKCKYALLERYKLRIQVGF